METTAVSPATRLREELQADLLAGYDDLIARLPWDREAIRRHQRGRLRELLGAASEHSRFHALGWPGWTRTPSIPATCRRYR